MYVLTFSKRGDVIQGRTLFQEIWYLSVQRCVKFTLVFRSFFAENEQKFDILKDSFVLIPLESQRAMIKNLLVFTI